jgi:hypothetical protein
MKTCKKLEWQLILQTQKQLTKIFLFMFHSMRPQEYQKSHMAISEWEKNIWGHFYNPVFKRD